MKEGRERRAITAVDIKLIDVRMDGKAREVKLEKQLSREADKAIEK